MTLSSALFSPRKNVDDFGYNIIGAQAIRCILARIYLKKRRKTIFAGNEMAEPAKTLLRKGYLYVPGALKRGNAKLLREELIRMRDAQVEEKEDPQKLVHTYKLPPSWYDIQPALKELFQELSIILGIAEGREVWNIDCYFEQFDSTASTQGVHDHEATFHCDTYFTTHKAWIYLNDVPADGPGFEYSTGSHRLGIKRIIFEYISSILSSRRGSWRIGQQLVRIFGKPIAFRARAGDVLIADTFGFHRRLPSAQKTKRYAINIVARYHPFGKEYLGQRSLRKSPVLTFENVDNGVD